VSRPRTSGRFARTAARRARSFSRRTCRWPNGTSRSAISTVAEGILDRIVHRAQRIELRGGVDAEKPTATGALKIALGISALLGGERDTSPFPHTPFPQAAASLPSLRMAPILLRFLSLFDRVKMPASLRSDLLDRLPENGDRFETRTVIDFAGSVANRRTWSGRRGDCPAKCYAAMPKIVWMNWRWATGWLYRPTGPDLCGSHASPRNPQSFARRRPPSGSRGSP
jgi:hypothetical protein